MRRLAPALTAFALALLVLWPGALAMPQHVDEAAYGWKSGYYWTRLAALDFRPSGPDPYQDPGFSPSTYWAVEQPLGTHLAYWIAMKITHTAPPSAPYAWWDPARQGPETIIPRDTLRVLRSTALLCSALGLALIAYRFRWLGLAAAAVILSIPLFRMDLSMAWAEGPLMLGFGLAALAWRTRWFAMACGLAAAFKPTGFVLWPLLLLPASTGSRRWGTVLGPAVAVTTFTLLTPVSWFGGGPLFIWSMVDFRIATFAQQSMEMEGPVKAFLPSRYFWPPIMAVVLALPTSVHFLAQRLWLLRQHWATSFGH